MHVRLIATVGLACTALLSSCTGADSPAGHPTGPTFSPAPHIRINVAARDATRDGGLIMEAGLVGTLRVSPQGCLYEYVPKTPRTRRTFRTDLVWPRGTTAALDESGTPVVVRYDGAVVARVGHSLRGLGGGGGVARRAADITCRVRAHGPLFYMQGEMPPIYALQ